MDAWDNFEEGYIHTSRGYLFFRRRHGRGKSIILVHGLGANSNTWKRLVGYLGNNMDIIALDLLGHGKSDAPDIDYRASMQADALFEFIRLLGIKSPILFGNSYGAWVCALYAGSIGACSLLVLEDCAGLYDEVSLLKELGELDEYKSKIFEETSRQNPSRQYVMSSIINNFENNLLDDNALFAIKCGTLIIWGSNDKVIPSAMGHILAGKLNGSALEIVEDGGHVPHILKPNKVASILKQFIDDM